MIQQAKNPPEAPVEEPKTIEPTPKVKEPLKPKEEPQILKKPAIPEVPKVEGLLKPEIPVAGPPPPGPPTRKVAIEKEQQHGIPVKPINQKILTEPKAVANAVIPSQSKEIKQPEIPKVEKPSEPEIIIKPKIQQANVGLNLNPEDFMVKQRPKTVTTVPKDAKNKLKTSPFGHVSNPVELKKPIPVSPAKLIKPKTPAGFIPPSKSIKPIVQTKPSIPSYPLE